MEAYFTELASLLDRALEPAEVYTCAFDAESSDFVRMNRGKIRQPGSVAQRYLRLHLIRDQRHAEQCLSLSGDLAHDRADVASAFCWLRATLAELPDDPHLSYATDVASSRSVKSRPLPAAEEVVASVLDAASGLDLVGIYAAGPVYRGFANSLGQRNWHEATSFNLQWSLYHRADKAVKSAYSGFDWSSATFEAKMGDARERLALLAMPPRSLEPGSYRAYLTPSAMEEIAGMLCWGGFSGRALATRQSCLFRVRDGEAAFDASVGFTENTLDGVAPAFQGEGFTRPDSVPLVEGGKLVGSLVSPRTAKEYALATNGANSAEMPESLDMAGGTLGAADALAALDRGLYIGNLWYLNFSDRPACRLTGMTRFASFWVEHGKVIAPVNVMRFDDSLFRLLGDRLVGLTAERELMVDGSSYRSRNVGSMRLPGAVVSEMAFTL
ncbi:MAG: metallopeptidase TldD-related protein [Pseudomonadota bacterium]|nr:metallopeptidase TldD-related protein [Pseudomonadota bacterium]